AVAIGRAYGRRGQVAVLDGKLDQGVEPEQRLVDGDVLMRLAGGEQRQLQQGGVGHRSRSPVGGRAAFTGSGVNRLVSRPVPRPKVAESWNTRTVSVSG